MKTSAQEAAQKAIDLLGGLSATAKRLHVTAWAVSKWRKKVPVDPVNRALQLEEATNGAVTRYELRPDIYIRSEDSKKNYLIDDSYLYKKAA